MLRAEASVSMNTPFLWMLAMMRTTLSVLWMLPIGCAAATSSPTAPAARVAGLDHIIVVVMENKNYDEVRTAPYIASLIASGSSFSNSHAIGHPSQPNYIAMWSGSTQGVTSDACPPPGSPFMAENLGHACERKGLTWKAYSENLPSAGSTACSANSGKYTRKHDPWTDFGNLNHQNERGYADLAADIGRGALPNLAFVVPNNCNNSHDCSVSTADGWLAGRHARASSA